MGVPIEEASWLLGDNKSVITSSTIPHSMLSKRHNALAYHRVRSAISGKFLKFCYVPSKQNTADILTKYLPYPELWPHVQTLLFWRGETFKKQDIQPFGECQDKSMSSGKKTDTKEE